MSKTWRVLSIDFDYFQEVDADTLRECYPDGIDNSTMLSEIVWANHYASNEEEILGVKTNEEELELLKKVLLNQKADWQTQKRTAPVRIANSHLGAYEMIHDYISKGDKVVLTNIDMHHDFVNDNPNVDCGNWIGRLSHENILVGLDWIANPVTAKMYGLDEKGDKSDTMDKLLASLMKSTVGNAADEQFDLIFLARSDTWTPPHLDADFQRLVVFLKNHFENVTIEKDVLNPRIQYAEFAEAIREQMNQAMYGKEIEL